MESARKALADISLLVWIAFSLQFIPGCSFYDPLFLSEVRLPDVGDSGFVTDGDEDYFDEDSGWGDFTCGRDVVLVNQGFDPPGPHGEIRISSADSINHHDGDGNKVVYTDNRGNPYLIDLIDETEVRLEDLLIDGVRLYRTWIRDDIVIYNGRATNNDGEYVSSIIVCDLQTKTGKILYGHLNDESSGRFWASTSQRRVVWSDPRFFTQHNQDYTKNKNVEIYMYDIGTDTETRVTNIRYQQALPDIFGNYIVWLDRRDLNYAVYLHKISTGEEHKISPDNNSQYSYPEIWGDSVVFVGEENTTYNPQGNVYHYSIENDELKPIGFGSNGCCYHVGEKYVVFARTGENTGESYWHDVYVYDLETQEEKRVTWRPSNNGHGIVMGDKILWGATQGGLFITPVDGL